MVAAATSGGHYSVRFRRVAVARPLPLRVLGLSGRAVRPTAARTAARDTTQPDPTATRDDLSCAIRRPRWRTVGRDVVNHRFARATASTCAHPTSHAGVSQAATIVDLRLTSALALTPGRRWRCARGCGPQLLCGRKRGVGPRGPRKQVRLTAGHGFASDHIPRPAPATDLLGYEELGVTGRVARPTTADDDRSSQWAGRHRHLGRSWRRLRSRRDARACVRCALRESNPTRGFGGGSQGHYRSSARRCRRAPMPN
jgi:hypothetical protein